MGLGGEIRTFLGEDVIRVESLMEMSLESDISLLNTVNDSILSNSGKKLRPMLALLVARACGGAITDDTVRYAAAAELLHNATLLHDDVADGGYQRRGNPTTMALYGSRASVLLGDYWLVKAMGEILGAKVGRDEAIAMFSATLGDLAEGEMLQLQKASSYDTTREDYYRIIFGKTASLFVSAAMSAAISVKADAQQLDVVKAYSRNLGLAFQIQDDILDYVGDEAIGKPAGQDLKEGKITLPLLGAMANATDEEVKYVKEKLAGGSADDLSEIMDFVRSHEGLAYARKELGNLVHAASAAAEKLPRCPERDYLVRLASYVADRDS